MFNFDLMNLLIYVFSQAGVKTLLLVTLTDC